MREKTKSRGYFVRWTLTHNIRHESKRGVQWARANTKNARLLFRMRALIWGVKWALRLSRPHGWLAHQEYALFPPVIGSRIKNILSYPLWLAHASRICSLPPCDWLPPCGLNMHWRCPYPPHLALDYSHFLNTILPAAHAVRHLVKAEL
eukprot:5016786-Pyramimonas_sp.AAC.1